MGSCRPLATSGHWAGTELPIDFGEERIAHLFGTPHTTAVLAEIGQVWFCKRRGSGILQCFSPSHILRKWKGFSYTLGWAYFLLLLWLFPLPVGIHLAVKAFAVPLKGGEALTWCQEICKAVTTPLDCGCLPQVRMNFRTWSLSGGLSICSRFTL